MKKWIFAGICFVTSLVFFVGCEEQQKSAVPKKELKEKEYKPSVSTTDSNTQDKEIKELIKKLEEHENDIASVFITDQLISIGKPAVPALIEALNDGNYRVRAPAAEALGRIADSQAIPSLINALKDKNSLVSYYATEGLRHIGKPSIPFLVKALKDKDDNIRYAAAGILDRFNGFLGEFKWEPQNDEEKASYLFAKRDFKTLANMNKPVAIPYLLELLENEDYVIREISAKALNNLNWKPQTDEENLLYLFAKRDFKALVKIGKPAVPLLIKALDDYSADDYYIAIRCLVADALGDIGDNQAVPALIDASNWLNVWVRMHTVESLGKIADKRAIPTLIERLNDSDSYVRDAAATALGRIADEQAIPALIETLADRDGLVHDSAVRALCRIGEPSIPVLMKRFKNGEFGADDIVIRTLVVIGKPAIPALIEALKDKSSLVRTRAAIALGDIGDEQAIPALREISADKSDENYSTSSFAEKAIEKIQKAQEEKKETPATKPAGDLPR